MALINLLAALVRRVVSFPLFQLLVTIVVILFLQAADSKSALGEIFNALDALVDYSVRACAAIFEVKSFTKSWLTTGFMIAYVYMAGLLLLFVAKVAINALVELVARSNALWLRNSIARQRGIAAYRAWLPLERIRPAHVPQEQWEETFAWPADNRPPYPSLTRRVLRATVTYVIAVLVIVVLLEAFTPLPVLTWLGKAVQMLWTGPR